MGCSMRWCYDEEIRINQQNKENPGWTIIGENGKQLGNFPASDKYDAAVFIYNCVIRGFNLFNASRMWAAGTNYDDPKFQSILSHITNIQAGQIKTIKGPGMKVTITGEHHFRAWARTWHHR